MAYSKVLLYGDLIEIYEYENYPRNNGRKRCESTSDDDSQDLAVCRKDVDEQAVQSKRRRDNTRRSAMAFRRLVQANLAKFDVPVLISLTYAENVTDIVQGHKDFTAFIRNAKNRFGNGIRFICVPEFQKRGSVHFHALFWGLPSSLVGGERRTRLVASLWGQGFVDIVQTDGNKKLAGYLSKYMSKAFEDVRMFRRKAYIASRNVKKPVIDKKAIVISYFYEYQLSPDLVLTDKIYATQWLGECRHRLFDVNKNKNEQDTLCGT